MKEDQTRWITVARLLRPQGRKGEVLADLLTDFSDRFSQGSRLFVPGSDFDGALSEARSVEVESSWLPHGRNEGRIVLAFTNIGTIEEAERLSGLDAFVPEAERLALTDGSLYLDELVGCTVYDKGVPVGTIRDVQFMTSPDGKRRLPEAAPLLVLDSPAGEALIPFAKEFILSLDVVQKRILMKLPDGLVDLNMRPAPPNS